MKRNAVLAAVAAFGICASGAALGADTHVNASKQGSADPIFSVTPGSITLYDQNGNSFNQGIVSESVEAQWEAYDSQGADDFTVPTGHKWKIKEVDVTGLGSAFSENVFFYKNRNGLPGKLVAECGSLSGTGNGSGSFVIKIPKGCPVTLGAGQYWISVQANTTYGYDWSWAETNIHKKAAAWQNYGPGNPYGVCPTWGSDCFNHHTDFMFALKGIDVVP